ncbi:uncharacterized protein UTRI_06245 [Ustilago trichophora]|uniref:Uncharacterized protein n=1 Tax=Ustilago trichophora TaxID=86804 RepID=A0A5C3EI59_9BASI|nr:uncharacterized protein UTRI_06245 [Ustilago trichophora]
MQRSTILFGLLSLMLLTMLQSVLAVGGRRARVQPLEAELPPPSSPPPLPDVMTSSRQPFRIHEIGFRGQYESSSSRLEYFLRNRYDHLLAHVEPAHISPISVDTLEQQIRSHATRKHFIRLGGEGPNSHEIRLAFAVDGTFQGDGQKYFSILTLRRLQPGFDPSFDLLGYVKASGVHGIVDRLHTVQDRLRLDWPGQALTSYQVFDQIRDL